MNELIQRTLAWKMVWSKGVMLTAVNMLTVIVASLQGWTRDYVDSMGWWSWIVLISSALVVGFNTIISYMDKTFHIEGDQVRLSNIKIEAEAIAVAKEEAKVEAEEAAKPVTPV